jgi:hypothetical protein
MGFARNTLSCYWPHPRNAYIGTNIDIWSEISHRLSSRSVHMVVHSRLLWRVFCLRVLMLDNTHKEVYGFYVDQKCSVPFTKSDYCHTNCAPWIASTSFSNIVSVSRTWNLLLPIKLNRFMGFLGTPWVAMNHISKMHIVVQLLVSDPSVLTNYPLDKCIW